MRWDAPFTVQRDASGAVRVPALLFDGACGFCTWSVRTIRTRDRDARVNYVASQLLAPTDFARLGVRPQRCANEVVFVDGARRVRGGAEAANAYLRTIGFAPATTIARLRLPRVLLRIESAVYRWIARHRETLSRVFGTARYALMEPSQSEPATHESPDAVRRSPKGP